MVEWLSTRPAFMIYGFCLLSALLESIVPPYPSDLFVLVLAFISGQGSFSPYALYGFTCAGSIAGIMTIYSIGRIQGTALIRFLSQSGLGRLLPVRMIEQAQQEFTRHEDIVILLHRFLPGMRAPLCFAAGSTGVKARKVFLYGLASVCVWNFFLVLAGFYVGATWYEASHFLRNYTLVVTALVVVLLCIVTLVYFRKRRG